jgi:hypothetical protein
MPPPTLHPDVNHACDNPSAADVYAGDIGELKSSTNTSSSVFLFRIEADAEPDVFARVASIFNIANTAPLQVTLRRGGPDQVNISVAIELSLESTADMIRRKLAQLTCSISADYFLVDSTVKEPI